MESILVDNRNGRWYAICHLGQKVFTAVSARRQDAVDDIRRQKKRYKEGLIAGFRNRLPRQAASRILREILKRQKRVSAQS